MYDDSDSLQVKVHWAVERGLAGVGFWALNYESGDSTFWQMVTDETTGLSPEEPVDTGTAEDTADDAEESDTASPRDTAPPSDSAAPELVAEPRGLHFSSAPVRCGGGLVPLLLAGAVGLRRRRRAG